MKIIRLVYNLSIFLKNVFNSVKATSRLRKETNRLLSKGMSNIFLKATIETFSKL